MKQLAKKFAAGELKSVELNKKPPFKRAQYQNRSGQPEEFKKRERTQEEETNSPPPDPAKSKKRIDAILRNLKEFHVSDEAGSSVFTPLPAPKKKPISRLRRRLCGNDADTAIHRINFIFGGPGICGKSINSIKADRRKEKSGPKEIIPLQGPNTKISFWESETSELDLHHDDALIIDLDVAGLELTKMMVDTGSSVDLIFYSVLQRMEIPDSRIRGIKMLLTGFAGETTISLGTIQLPVIAGGVEKIVDFVVVDRKAPFHVILGRPWIHTMKAVASTYHQCIKFPSPNGIRTIRGCQSASRICYAKESPQ
ncbi:hypothetical protein V5N11_018738 [Cardamine amara subsp. amara]|uniref:Peptidase A2 domain-containing protein n=1 Tax=Cardamine amara subsp. amara TaxID=228776 RepID=A0ABD1BEV3_CARAN